MLQLQRLTIVAPVSSGGIVTVKMVALQWQRAVYVFISWGSSVVAMMRGMN
jgi:hypothetical protein